MTKHTYIIAEIGCNHNGSLDIATKLIDKAVESGVDCVKFQTFKADALISKHAEKAEYQKKTTDATESQLDMTRKLEMPYEHHQFLIDYCKNKKVDFISAPFDFGSIDFLAQLNVDKIKVPSGEITNLPYLRKINALRKPVILSTGMATLDEVKSALEILKDCSISLLHCTTEYPCPYEGVNLNAMLTLKEKFGLPVGYSDHTKGIEVPIAAVAMGAEIIEKHFTLDKNMPGPDHKASLEPEELKAMVSAIRHVDVALGDGKKEPAECEKKNIAIARKSLVAKKDIKKGEMFTEKNLTVKRPGNGISPMKWDEYLGKFAEKDYKEDDLI